MCISKNMKKLPKPAKKPWKKILYERQAYPDNYTDKKTFLRDLRTNINRKNVTIWEAVSGAALLLQEFCTVVAFALTYVYLFNEWIAPSEVLVFCASTTLTGFFFYRFVHNKKQIRRKIGADVRTVLIFMVFGHLFSPVLHTLTDTVSTDTIYTMSFFMMIVHLIFFDYGVGAAIVSNSLSLSAAIFASICLASRLASAYQAFILISVAIELFVLFPLLRKFIKNSWVFTGFLVSFDLYFLWWTNSWLFTVLFVLVVLFINVLCPVLFVRYQKYKYNIYGPWDEAVVDDSVGFIHKLLQN